MDHTDVKRVPLLSDTAITELYYIHGDLGNGGTSEDALIAVRDFYEAKITSGELIDTSAPCSCGRPLGGMLMRPYSRDGVVLRIAHCPECGMVHKGYVPKK